MDRILKIGTRGSRLALAQANEVQRLIEKANPDIKTEIIVIRTKGDKILDSPLSQIEGKGLFTREIETALLEEKIDLAVHSLKDLPTENPPGLCLGAFPPREDPRDVLIAKAPLEELPEGTVFGTSSLRRQAQLFEFNKKFKVISIRGNVETRLKKMEKGECDALILAGAGLHRLGMKHKITSYLDPEEFVPPAAQGIIGIQIREKDFSCSELVGKINHPLTTLQANVERAFLAELKGGCRIPAGCYTRYKPGDFFITAFVGDPEGKILIRRIHESKGKDPEKEARQVAQGLLEAGGKKIIKKIRENIK